jgi:hypothetical protein
MPGRVAGGRVARVAEGMELLCGVRPFALVPGRDGFGIKPRPNMERSRAEGTGPLGVGV